MTEIECVVCKDKIPSHNLNDAKWEYFHTKKQVSVYICRDCAKIIARLVVEEY